MSKLIIRGAGIEDITSWCNNEGLRVVEITMRAAWSSTVCEEFNWTKEPSGFGNSPLDPKRLAGVNMILEPTDKKLADYRMDLAISHVGSFRHLAKTEDGEIVSRQLEFVVTTVADDALTVLDQWLKICGPAKATGQCQIRYEAEKQMELGEEGKPADGTDAPPAPEPMRGRRKASADAGVQ